MALKPCLILSFCRHHQFFRHCRYAHMFDPTHSTFIFHPPTSSGNTHHLYRRRINSPRFLINRPFFSTPPTTTSKSKGGSDAHTIAPSPVKARVELRPGPIKVPITPVRIYRKPRSRQRQTPHPNLNQRHVIHYNTTERDS